jgi:peroxiredoxin Q/BCP
MSMRDRRTVEPRPLGPKRREQPRALPWRGALVALGVTALLAASFVVPRFFEDAAPTRAAGAHGTTPASGDGPDLGSAIPFDERDVVTGEAITSTTVAGRKTLLFFSEGVMCQACFVQIQDLESVGSALQKRGIDLVAITPDPPETLRQAIEGYAIRTPMVADDDRTMSAAFDTLGQGMHPDTPGHAFVLIDERGKVVWQRDYWLHPYRTMYVEPDDLLAAIPST